ncbi:MAG: hypothetical protein L0338_39765 [Acidobacteria bacterium]|nr:hypothetical protein [Acidobacteriota bacterium]
MNTSYDLHPQEPEALRVCYARRIYVGQNAASFQRAFLTPLLSLHPIYRVQGYVLDLSPDGALERVIREAQLPEAVLSDLRVLHTLPDDETAQESFWRLVLDCDPGVRPNEVLLELNPRDFPQLATACRGLASNWFLGSRPKGSHLGWRFEGLTGQTDLDDLRAQLTNRCHPRRPDAVLIAPPHLRDSFAAHLYFLSWSWLSFMQLVEDAQQLEELWPWPEPPDLFLCDGESFEAMNRQGRWSRAVCVLAVEDRQRGMRLVNEWKADAVRRMSFPEVIVVWSPQSDESVKPAWVTTSLPRSYNPPPSDQALKNYRSRPELERQIRELWQTERPRVVGLIGFGGNGKTTLALRFLKERSLAQDQGKLEKANWEMPPADGLFHWDFYKKPYSEEFLWGFAHYLSPGILKAATSEQCLGLIRQGLLEKPLRRTLLMLDGLEFIQDQRKSGEIRSPFVLKLLEEVIAGKLPVFVILITRYEPVGLQAYSLRLGDRKPPILLDRRFVGVQERLGEGYVSIQVGELEEQAAFDVLRAYGVRDEAYFATLKNNLSSQAITVQYFGQLIHDFYQGNPDIKLPEVRFYQQVSDEKENEINRKFFQVLACFEDRLPQREVAVLKRLAEFAAPLSVADFAKIFVQPGGKDLAGPLAGLLPDELQVYFDGLVARQLLTVYVESDQTPRYATHLLVSNYFASAFTDDVEAYHLGADEHLRRQLLAAQAREPESIRGAVRTRGAVRIHRKLRTRGVAAGPRGVQTEYPTEEVTLDLLEQIIFHTVRAGYVKEAKLFYERRMGGDEHLEAIGQQERAQRIKAQLRE